MDCKMVWVAITAAWMLWQETLLPNTLGQPSWQLDSEFSGESTCGEARKIRLLDQILRAGNEGTTIINQPTIQEGTVWLEQPNGDRTRLRLNRLCPPPYACVLFLIVSPANPSHAAPHAPAIA